MAMIGYGQDQVAFSPVDEAGAGRWSAQREAVRRAKAANQRWKSKRRSADAQSSLNPAWKRVSYSLPRAEAQKKAREFLKKYPKAAYWSEVESWRELPGDVIEFTMRRLPSAD